MKSFFTTTRSNNISVFWFKVILLSGTVFFLTNTGLSQTVISEDWESGIGSWYVDNGLWEVGIPTVGPDTVHSGQNCAGTVLNGNYTPNANTRLISPYITLPSISSGEHIKLKFWYWFRVNVSNLYGNDKGFVQISVNNGTWQTLTDPIGGYSPAWTQGYVDLSEYADSTVRIAFYFTSTSVSEDNGWYIDDVSVTVGTSIFNNPEDFESGIGDWSADSGLWEFGIPTVGPSATHSGQNCIGTILNGNYTPDAHTRLVSPYITLIPQPSGFIGLYYWSWFRIDESSLYGDDKGYVQISVNYGAWQTISGPISGDSPVWTQAYVDLTPYADSTVRIAFYFTSTSVSEDNGWYIDDVRIEGIVTDISDNQNEIPNTFSLLQNYPNPFNPSTKISWQSPVASWQNLKVYDVLGNEVVTLVNEYKPAGFYDTEFNATNLPSGVYFYELKVGSFVATKKMVLIK